MKNHYLPSHTRRTSPLIFGLMARTLPFVGAMALAGTASAQCIDSSKIVANPVIPQVIKYVCGCNETTYMNSAEATASGVVSYTEGACPFSVLRSMYISQNNSAAGDTAAVSMLVAQTAQLASSYSTAIDWSQFAVTSSDANIATVSTDGTIAAVAKGTAVITVTLRSSGETKSLVVQIIEPLSADLKSMYLAKNKIISGSYSGNVSGNSTYITHTLNCNCPIDWEKYTVKSSNSAIAEVAENGKILAIARGTATITVTEIASGQSIALPIDVTENLPQYFGTAERYVGDTILMETCPACKNLIDWDSYSVVSSDPAVAKPIGDGKIVGVAAGTATITLTSISTGSFIDFTITFLNKEPISADLKSMYLASSQIDLTTTTTIASAANCNCVINWKDYTITTSNPDVAKSEGVLIIPIGVGTTNILITKTSTGQTVTLPLTVIKTTTMADMHLADTQIIAGNTTYITWDANCDCPIDWTKYTITSSVPAVATATSAGQITGIAPGTTVFKVIEISSGKEIGFPLTVLPLSGDVSLLDDMYFGSDSIVLGSATRIACKQSAGIDWTKFAITATSGVSVTTDGVVRGLKAESNTVTITHIASGTKRTLPIRVTYNFFNVEHVEMYVGDTVNVPINHDYAEYFNLQVDGVDYFKFDASNFTATATAVGAGYAGVLFYYKSDNTFAQGLKFLIKEKPVVTPPVGDASVLADMYLGRDTIALGDTTNFFCKQNVQIDWSKFDVSSYDGPTVKDGVVSGCKTHEDAVIIVTHIATKAQRKFVLNVHYDYFTTDHVEMNVGDTVKVPINPNYAEYFYLETYGADYFKFDEETMTATATAVGEGYAGVLCYYKSDSSFAEGIKFAIKDTASAVVKPTIKAVKLLNGGYTLEITFDAPVELYPGIEADFMVAMNNALKASGTYTVTKVMAKEGNPNTLVLIMAEAVPVNGFTVQYKTSKAFAVATSVAEEGAQSAVIYPNPAQNTVTFSAEGLIEATISTISGQLLIGSSAVNNSTEINISHLPAGQYIATFITDNGTLTQMLTVK